MADTPVPETLLVDRPEALARLWPAVVGQPVLGVDTEGNSFFAYRERLCLLQISTPQLDAVIDLLADLDLTPLAAILDDPAVTKIFHDGEQDLPALRRDLRMPLRGLFDTKVACSALGDSRVGLASQLADRLGIHVDKGQQRSDWGKRPLSAAQLHYAAADTRHLAALQRVLAAELVAAPPLIGRLVAAEHARLEALVPTDRPVTPDDFAAVKGAGKLRGLALRALRELFWARERWARHADMPPTKALPNGQLIKLATLVEREPVPGDVETLTRTSGLPRGLMARHARWILPSLDEARRRGPLPRGAFDRGPEPPPLSPAAQRVHERLKAWRRTRAEQLRTDPALLLQRELITTIARARPRSLAALSEVAGLEPWRLEAFGAELLAAVNGDGR